MLIRKYIYKIHVYTGSIQMPKCVSMQRSESHIT